MGLTQLLKAAPELLKAYFVDSAMPASLWFVAFTSPATSKGILERLCRRQSIQILQL